MRALKIDSLSKFQVYTVLLTIVTAVHINFLEFIHPLSDCVYPLPKLFPCSPPVSPGNNCSTLFLWVQLFYISHINKILQCFSFSVQLILLSIIYSFHPCCCKWQGSFLFTAKYIHTYMKNEIDTYFTFSLYIHLLTDTKAVSVRTC